MVHNICWHSMYTCNVQMCMHTFYIWNATKAERAGVAFWTIDLCVSDHTDILVRPELTKKVRTNKMVLFLIQMKMSHFWTSWHNYMTPTWMTPSQSPSDTYLRSRLLWPISSKNKLLNMKDPWLCSPGFSISKAWGMHAIHFKIKAVDW